MTKLQKRGVTLSFGTVKDLKKRAVLRLPSFVIINFIKKGNLKTLQLRINSGVKNTQFPVDQCDFIIEPFCHA